MMELGNMVWGNSRGEFEVPRKSAWTGPLVELMMQAGCDIYGIPGFENDVFIIRSYYWGDCECGYEEVVDKWDEENEHKLECYQIDYKALKQVEMELRNEVHKRRAVHTELEVEEPAPGAIIMGWESVGDEWTDEDRAELKGISEWERIERKALCKKHGIPWNDGYGSAVHCTCDYQARWDKFSKHNDHAADCPIVLPTLHYLPADFKLDWYKYPLRDSYMNQDVSIEQFLEIIATCQRSLACR